MGSISLGKQRLQNIADPVRVYRILLDSSMAGEVTGTSHRPSARTMILSAIGIAALLVAVLAIVALQFDWRKPLALQRTSVAILPFTKLSGDQSLGC